MAEVILMWPSRLLFVLAIGLLSSWTSTAEDKANTSPPQRIVIQPEPIELSPGAPISSWALTARPAPLRGVRSWTLETKLHRGPIFALAHSPDGSLLATGGLDASIRLWDTATGQLSRILAGHNGYVYTLAWSPDGQTLASGANDATVRLWDVKTGRPLRTIKGYKGPINMVAWSVDGRTIAACGTASGWIRLIDAPTGIEIRLMEQGEPAYAIGFSLDGKTLASAHKKYSVQLWNLDTGKAFKALEQGGEGDTYTLSWSPDGKRLAAGGKVSTYVWDVEAGKILQTIVGHASSVSWSPDGKTLAIIIGGASVQLWNPEDGKQIRTLAAPGWRMIWSPDSKSLTTAGAAGKLQTWEAGTGKLLTTIEGHGTGFRGLAWSRDAKTLAGACEDGAGRLWEATSGKALHVLGDGFAYSVAWAPDHKVIATGGKDGKIRCWEAATGKELRQLEAGKGLVATVAWSREGRIAAAAGEKSIKIWDAQGKLLFTLEGHTALVTTVAWSADGQKLASGASDNLVKLWNAPNGKLLKTLDKHSGAIYHVAWSPDGKTLATGSYDRTLRFWNPLSGQQIHQSEGIWTTALTWAPDSKLLTTGGSLWDPGTGKTVRSFWAYGHISAVTWSPDGSTMAVGSGNSYYADGMIRFWEPSTGQLRGVLIVDGQHHLAIDPDGHFRCPAEAENALVYVVLTDTGTEMLGVKEFAAKHRWKNAPGQVRLTR
jgi:WD40 repeat protein